MKLLYLAFKESEAKVNNALRYFLEEEKDFDNKEVENYMEKQTGENPVQSVEIAEISLEDYDNLHSSLDLTREEAPATENKHVENVLCNYDINLNVDAITGGIIGL